MPQRFLKRKSNEKGIRYTRGDIDRIEHIAPTPVNSNSSKSEIVPNRVFVGGISSATEWEIRSKFSCYGIVKAVNIIRDRDGVSKGYGFVTYNTNEEAKNVLEKTEVIIKGRKLNVAPAIKKQPHRLAPLSFASAAGSYTECVSDDLTRNRLGNYNSSRYNDYPLVGTEILPYPCELPPFMENFYGASENYQNYGNPPVNCFLPYPTLVYLPQGPFPYPPTGINYPVGSNLPEMYQILAAAAPTCYFSPERK